MTIEVRQLVIRSTVESGSPPTGELRTPVLPEQYKEELLRRCRELVLEVLREKQER